MFLIQDDKRKASSAFVIDSAPSKRKLADEKTHEITNQDVPAAQPTLASPVPVETEDDELEARDSDKSTKPSGRRHVY